jgi:hypothetical protein
MKSSYDPDAIVNFDDGSRIYLAYYSGGASSEGAFGKLGLMQVGADGKITFRNYEATEDWRNSEVSENEK